jgi:hypothetical protein
VAPPALQAVLAARHVAVPPAQGGLLVQITRHRHLEFIGVGRAQAGFQQALVHGAGIAALHQRRCARQQRFSGLRQFVVGRVGTQGEFNPALGQQVVEHGLGQPVTLTLQAGTQGLGQAGL